MSITENKISQAGDVNIEDVTIITSTGFAQTVTPQVMGIEIYEDMFASFVTGKLMLKDSQNLTNLFPLIGEESVRIKINTPSLPEKDAYSGEFFIYKMDDNQKVSEREVVYVLHFISKDAINDMNKKISKGYSGKISDIVLKLLKDPDGLATVKNINVEETKNTTKYVSNFWSPIKNIQFLCENSVNMADSPSYIFFENKYGLNFVSFESLYAGTPLHQRFIWDNYSAEINKLGSSSADLEKDYQRVIEFQTPNSFNYIERIQSGMYGSEIVYYDIMTKQYVHTSYKPDFQADGKHLNPNPMWSEKIPARPKSLLIHEHQYYNNFDGYDVTSNTKIIQKRKSLMAQAEAYKVTISVFGRTDYSAGQRVYLSVPKNAQHADKTSDYEDKVMSGNYLISALCHFITREKHECTMELIKDSYIINLNELK